MISENSFVNKYHKEDETYVDFLRTYKVQMRGQMIPLSTYARRKGRGAI